MHDETTAAAAAAAAVGNRERNRMEIANKNTNQYQHYKNRNREPYANDGRRQLLSMELKQKLNDKQKKAKPQQVEEVTPRYFNVSQDRKFPVSLYWEERQNSDFRHWVQHRRVIEYSELFLI